MRSFPTATLMSLLAVAVFSAPAAAQVQKTLMYDHVHMAVPDPGAAAQWYHDNIGGEWIDGRTDRLLFGRTRIMFLRGEGRRPSQGGVVDHLGFSFPDLASKLSQVEAAGAEVTPMRDIDGLFKLAFITDPWGVRLELVEDTQHLGFHHIHLRSQDPEATFDWYERMMGGVRINLKGMLPGILYPGNVWLLVQRGETFPTSESVIDHIGWRSPVSDTNQARVVSLGAEVTSEPRDMTLPNGQIRFFYIAGPEGARVEFVQRQADMK